MTVLQGATIEAPGRGGRGLRPRVAFGICAGLLAATVVSVGVIQMKLNVILDKAPVYLHKKLEMLDKAQIAPYRFVQQRELDEETIEALGTKDYIEWTVEDTRRQANDPLRYAALFVTYYTGGRTQVPHTPERCFLGANFQLESSRVIHFTVPGVGEPSQPKDVSAKVLVFTKAGMLDLQQQTVVYTFYANCDYGCEADYVRLLVNKLGIPKSFFSKVEVSFAGGELGATGASSDKAAQVAQELLQVVLPVLMREHWPRPDELTTTRAEAAP